MPFASDVRFWLGTAILMLCAWGISFEVGYQAHWILLSPGWLAPIAAGYLALRWGRAAYLALLLAAPLLFAGIDFQWASGLFEDSLYRAGAWIGFSSLQAAAVIATAIALAEFRDLQVPLSGFRHVATFAVLVLLTALSITFGIESPDSEPSWIFSAGLMFGDAPLVLGLAAVSSGLISLREGFLCAAIFFTITALLAAIGSVCGVLETECALSGYWPIWDTDASFLELMIRPNPESAILLAAGMLGGGAIRPVLSWLRNKGGRPKPKFGLLALSAALAVPGLLAFQAVTTLMQRGFEETYWAIGAHSGETNDVVAVPPPPPPPPPAVSACRQFTVYFNLGDPALSQEAMYVISEAAGCAMTANLVILGHADGAEAATGDAFELGWQRAEAVRDALIARGASNITLGSAGFNAPLVPNEIAVREAQNRRVEIVSVPRGGSLVVPEAPAPQPLPGQQYASQPLLAANLEAPEPQLVTVTGSRIRTENWLPTVSLLFAAFAFAISAARSRRALGPALFLLAAVPISAWLGQQVALELELEPPGYFFIEFIQRLFDELSAEIAINLASLVILLWCYAFTGALVRSQRELSASDRAERSA